jgi:hypothetical protein
MKRFQVAMVLSTLVTAFTVAAAPQVSGTTPAPTSCRQPAVAVVAVAPKFPEIARKARFTQILPVDITIDASGWVTSAKLPDGTPEFLNIGELSIRAAKRWRFNEDFGCSERSARLHFHFRPAVPIGWGAGTVFKPPFLVEIVEEEVEVHAVS